MSENVRFTAKQLRYIEWLAETKYDRSPVNRELLATELGVTSRTLRRWQKLNGFGESVRERTRELLREEFPEILGALRREAGKGSYQHIRLALEMLGEYMPMERHEMTGAGGGAIRHEEVNGITPERKDELLKAIIDRIQKRDGNA